MYLPSTSFPDSLRLQSQAARSFALWRLWIGPSRPRGFVFTVCDDAANEVCPIWPGQPMTAHWGVPDPAKVMGTEAEIRFVFANTMRMLTQRISVFTSLPIESLSRLSLQKHLDDIGKLKADTEPA